MYKLPQFQVIKSKNQESWVQGRFQLGGGRLGARPSLSDSGGGGARRPPPPGFSESKEKEHCHHSHHYSNKKRDKDEEG